MTPNPPIPGHELMFEGRPLRRYHPDTGDYDGWSGGCRCGAQPEGWPDLSITATKRWHRQHKAELRSEAVAS